MANALVYRQKDPAEYAPRVEEVVRKDLGAVSPVKYVVHETGNRSSLGGTMLRQAFGGAVAMAEITFELPWRRQATLTAMAEQTGVVMAVIDLVYDFELERAVAAPIELQRKRFVATDPSASATADRLNAQPGLVDRLRKVLNDHVMVNMKIVTVEPVVRIVPDGAGSRLQIRTLAKLGGIVIANATTNAAAFVALAREIDPLVG
ncbi:MAG TPA: hypothetical protein VJ850_10765 [Candidatus Limnocylindrales bacterium]|nr:hypothetical protein [Candidatus Limnocylindrales bacterium]